jgi:hypothetical protein
MGKIDWNKAMSELEDAKNYIEDYVIECATRLVEEQEEVILKTIQRIGGNVFIDITVDKNKVIEALTDYQKKVKGKSDLVEVVRCKDCEYLMSGNGFCWCEEHSDGFGDYVVYVDADDFCSFGIKKES